MKAILLLATLTCYTMHKPDTLSFNGRQVSHVERYIECVTGHWPNWDSDFYKKVGR